MGQFAVDNWNYTMYGFYNVGYDNWLTLIAMKRRSGLSEEFIIEQVTECGGSISGHDVIEFEFIEDAKRCVEKLNAALVMNELLPKEPNPILDNLDIYLKNCIKEGNNK
jgi:hypothetical protein